MWTPLVPLIWRPSTPLYCQFYENIGHPYPIKSIKNNFNQEYSCFFFKIIPPDEDIEVENCMVSELGQVT